ncbi:hypothetical protein STAFG_0117 [Streptomyces afghaniensis 772]|uniref:Uncharacterized protein n=1 Tax=Streptomyces afghaniensis 772 TaxID=1283301 RepID=S4N4A0_9ACTN|nr:hypothetical protein STAFG_0117 [Streptomyces afghaniensis 772]
MIAETAPVDIDERAHVRVVGRMDTRGTGDPFPWARLGTPALLRYARGWTRAGQWTADGRRFAALRTRSSRTASSSAEPRRGRR